MLAEVEVGNAQYDITRFFGPGEAVTHSRFGNGVVLSSYPGKVLVRFAAGVNMLAHNREKEMHVRPVYVLGICPHCMVLRRICSDCKLDEKMVELFADAMVMPHDFYVDEEKRADDRWLNQLQKELMCGYNASSKLDNLPLRLSNYKARFERRE